MKKHSSRIEKFLDTFCVAMSAFMAVLSILGVIYLIDGTILTIHQILKLSINAFLCAIIVDSLLSLI
jgi:hypothetical protein